MIHRNTYEETVNFLSKMKMILSVPTKTNKPKKIESLFPSSYFSELFKFPAMWNLNFISRGKNACEMQLFDGGQNIYKKVS